MKYIREGFNENYFEKIDSEDKAYFLGFIVADGCIIKDNENTKKKAQNRLVIGIQERDREILEILNNKITPYKKLNVFIRNRKHEIWQNNVTFKVNSNKICNDLEKLGVNSRKSGNETFPDLKEELITHFIRGFFDGDGCIYIKTINKTCKHGGKLKNKIVFCCLNKQFLEMLQIKLNNFGKIKAIKRKNRQEIFIYTIDKNIETINFFTFIYQNSSVYLKRKYNKFLQGNPVLTNILTNISNVETTS
jgi:intein/homing endonuclease